MSDFTCFFCLLTFYLFLLPSRSDEKRGEDKSSAVIGRSVLLALLGLETVTLPSWYDVDDADSLQTLMRETLSGIGFSKDARSHDARHSAIALRRLKQGGSFPEGDDPLRRARLNEARSA